MTTNSKTQPDERIAAMDAARSMAELLFGDLVLVPFKDGEPDWDICDRQSLEKIGGHWEDIEPADIPRLAILTDGFDRFLQLGADASVVTLIGDGCPTVKQIDGSESEAAINAVMDAIANDVPLRQFEPATRYVSDNAPLSEKAAERIASRKSSEAAQLEAQRVIYGGEIRNGTLFGATVNGKIGQLRFIDGEICFVAAAANDNKPAAAKPAAYPGMVSSGDLVRGFVPPDYHVDGITQRGFLYSTTAMTGTGKTAVLLLIAALTALGEPLGDIEVTPGRAVYFAGENPDDVTMRWIGMAHHMGFDADTIDVHFIKGTFSIPQMFQQIRLDVERLGGASMIVIDTSAAYFNGDDENSNTQLGNHARELRQLTTLKGSPAVYIAAHPIKNPDPSNLLPRGGGSFVSEVDGNLVLLKKDGAVKLTTHGKHRGIPFEPVLFELSTVKAPALKDSRGRDVPTVMASVLSKGEAREQSAIARSDDDEVLIMIENDGNRSLAAFAESMGWVDKDGKLNKERVRRATDRLKKDKLVDHKARKWTLTTHGTEAVADARSRMHTVRTLKQNMDGMLERIAPLDEQNAA